MISSIIDSKVSYILLGLAVFPITKYTLNKTKLGTYIKDKIFELFVVISIPVLCTHTVFELISCGWNAIRRKFL